MRSSFCTTLLTEGGSVIGTVGVSTLAPPNRSPPGLPRGSSGGFPRSQAFGPVAASGTLQRPRFSYHDTAAASHVFLSTGARRPFFTPVITAGWLVRGVTSSDW